MPRLCFVIMPFATTESCSEAEWTGIFDTLIKPAVEGDPDLGYECRRSTPTRGNLVRGILEDLDAAHVVIADLTDRNANVFYELGVRHTLTDRTIIISQDRARFVPFDLGSYANHEYDWRTEDGRASFATEIRRLLREVDDRPDRPDNPVSDFLREARGVLAPPTEMEVLRERVDALEEQLAAVAAKAQGAPGGRLERSLGRSLLGERPEGGWSSVVPTRSG